MTHHKQKLNLLTRAPLKDHLPFILCNKQRINKTHKACTHTHTHTYIGYEKILNKSTLRLLLLMMHLINLAERASLNTLKFAHTFIHRRLESETGLQSNGSFTIFYTQNFEANASLAYWKSANTSVHVSFLLLSHVCTVLLCI